MRALLLAVVSFAIAPFLLLAALVSRKTRRELVWGTTPIINNKYWSEAMRAAGFRSTTLMSGFYSINARADFDLYFEDLPPSWIPTSLRRGLGRYLAFLYVIRHARVLHLPFSGGPLGDTSIWWLEAPLLRLAGIRTVLIPFGGDVFRASLVIDPCIRHGLLRSYPGMGRDEARTAARLRHWCRHADVVLSTHVLDGVGRWDVLTCSPLCIDTARWRPVSRKNAHDGHSGPVRVLHAPNHRGIKGTEFVLAAVEALRAEGLQIELVLAEKLPNEKVRDLMEQIDVVVDQLILVSYAMTAIEAMASGLPVLANLDHEAYTRVFRRYAFLDECPVLSTTPETVVENLRTLVTRPALRDELGRAGRAFVEKYHSYEAAGYLFGSIHDRIVHGKDVDLMSLYHPLTSDYCKRGGRIAHPLVENRLPRP